MNMKTVLGAAALCLLLLWNVGAAPAAAEPVWKAVPIPSPVPATEGLAQLPGTRLWYWDTGGKGPAIVLLHAATGSGAFWGYQQPVLAKAGYRVIGYSRRGYYKSDLGDKNDPGIGSEDLNNLMNLLGVGKFHIVANAAGGLYAADYALSHPKRLLSISFVSTTMGIVDKDWVELGNLIRPRIFAQLPPDFQELGPSYRAGNPAGAAAWLELEKKAIVGPERIDPKTTYELTWANVEKIKLPTMLLTGEADLYAPPSIIRMQATHLPQAEVYIVREAAHHAYWEQPETFNRILLAFLAKHNK